MQSTDPSVDPDEGLPSRSEVSAEERVIFERLWALADSLAALSASQLESLGFPDVLERAITELGRVKKGARVRQRRYVARQLRERDVEAIAHAVALFDPTSPESQARQVLIERWRERMLGEGGDGVVEEFLARYADAERQPLRQKVRAARKDAAKGKPLFQYVREANAAADDAPGSRPAPRPETEGAG